MRANLPCRLARDVVDERRRARRWGILFKFLTLGFLFLLFFSVVAAFVGKERTCIDKCTAQVEVRGEIVSNARASAEHVISGLQAAFKNTGTKGVVVRINSPGGSPVQAGQIYDEMRRLRAAYPDKPLFAVVEDVAASGGYYVAAAADKIYVDKASMIGSIGVIISTLNYRDLLGKVGLEAVVFKSGKFKDMLSGAREMTPEEKVYVEGLVMQSYDRFVGIVARSRNLDEQSLRGGVADGRILSGSDAYAANLVRTIAPSSLRVTRQQVYTDLHRDVGSAVAESELLLDQLTTGHEYREGVRALLEKREPNF